MYSIQPVNVRFGIKKNLGTAKLQYIDPSECVYTELNQDTNKIKKMITSKAWEDPILVLSWGCVPLVLDGHHRVSAAIIAGEKSICAKISVYPC